MNMEYVPKEVLSPDHEDFGFTKVCIPKRRTKLKFDLWCDSLGKERSKNIQPFVMICSVVNGEEEWMTISIDKVPRVICGKEECFKGHDMVLNYIKEHRGILLMHWFGEIDDLELCMDLQDVEK